METMSKEALAQANKHYKFIAKKMFCNQEIQLTLNLLF